MPNENGILTENELEFIANMTSMFRTTMSQRLSGQSNARDIDKECGYPEEVTILQPLDYRQMYDKFGIASRVVNLFPDEMWGVNPEIYDDPTEGKITPFEDRFNSICKDLAGESWLIDNKYNPFWEHLWRLDRLAGIGRFGVLLLGLGIEGEMSQPLPGFEDDSDQNRFGYTFNAEAELKKQDKGDRKEVDLLYMRVFDESLVQVAEYESRRNNRRYGRPLYYNITLNDPFISHTGVGSDSGHEVRVHWSRVIHFCDDMMTSEVYGVPRQRPVWSHLLDLRKTYGGSAEMYWQGAFPGLSFETHPQLGTAVKIDSAAMREQVQSYFNGLQRYFALTGTSAKTLAPQIVDPTSQLEKQLEGICIKLGCPVRIFKGSERGELASSQDKDSWDERLLTRWNMIGVPKIVGPTIDRLIQIGVLPIPAKGYYIDRPDNKKPNKTEQAQIASSRMQAVSTYVSSGADVLIPPMTFLTHELGYTQEEAKKIIEEAAKLNAEVAEDNEEFNQAQQEEMAAQGFGAQGGPPSFQGNVPDQGGGKVPPQLQGKAPKGAGPTTLPFPPTANQFDPNQPRAKDGKWTDGGASDELSESSYAIMEKYKDEQAWSKPIQEFMEANGLKIEDYNKANEALYQHNIASGPESDKRLNDLWNSDTSEGKALRLMSKWQEWQAQNTTRYQEELNISSIMENVQKGTDKYGWDKMRSGRVGGDVSPTIERYRSLLESRAKGEHLFYRRGPLDKAAISTTKDPKGANTGSGRIKPDRYFTYQEMKDQGYHLLSGMRGMVGMTSSKEEEAIWLKPTKEPTVNEDSSEGIWRTTDDGQKIFIKDGVAYGGGPNGPSTEPKKEGTKVLHGTSLDRVKSILAEGIVPKAELQKMAWPGVGDKDKGDKVYTTDSLEVAKWYGRTHSLYTKNPEDFAVFEIEVPEGTEGITSGTEGGSQFKVIAYDKIPPSWIKSVYVSQGGSELVRKSPTELTTNEKVQKRFVPVFLGATNLTDNFDPNQPRAENGRWTDGTETSDKTTEQERAGFINRGKELSERLRQYSEDYKKDGKDKYSEQVLRVAELIDKEDYEGALKEFNVGDLMFDIGRTHTELLELKTEAYIAKEFGSDWGTKPGTYIAWRSGEVGAKAGTFFSIDKQGADDYAPNHGVEESKRYLVTIKNPLSAKRLEEAYSKLTGKPVKDIIAQREKAKDIGKWWITLDQKIRKEAVKKGYDSVVYTKPAPPAIRELVVFEENSITVNAFCPTGKGGGIDNSCPPKKMDDGGSYVPLKSNSADPFLMSVVAKSYAKLWLKQMTGEELDSTEKLNYMDRIHYMTSLSEKDKVKIYGMIITAINEDDTGAYAKLEMGNKYPHALKKTLGIESYLVIDTVPLVDGIEDAEIIALQKGKDLALKIQQAVLTSPEDVPIEQMISMLEDINSLPEDQKAMALDKMESVLDDNSGTYEMKDMVQTAKSNLFEKVYLKNKLEKGAGLSPEEEEKLYADINEFFPEAKGTNLPSETTVTESQKKFPDSLDSLEHVKNLGGTTGATLVRDPATGNLYVKKKGNNPDHIRNEYRVEKIYEAAGVPVLTSKLYDDPNSPVKLSVYQPNLVPLSQLSGQKYENAVAKIREDFALDATLANWDVIGQNMDNVMVDPETGTVYRIDVGGSMSFRAQGGLKLSQWNDANNELSSMKESPKNPTAKKIFGPMEDEQVIQSITKMENKSHAIMVAMKENGVSEADQLKFQARLVNAQTHKGMLDAAESVHVSKQSTSTVISSVSAANLKALVTSKKMGSDFAEKVAFLNPNGIEGDTVFVPMVGGPSGSWKANNKQIIDHMKSVLPPGTKLQGVMINKMKEGGFKISTKTEEKLYEQAKKTVGVKAPHMGTAPVAYVPGSSKVIPGMGGTVTKDASIDFGALGLPQVSEYNYSTYSKALSEMTQSEKEPIKKFTGIYSSEIRKAFWAPNDSDKKYINMGKKMVSSLKKIPAYNGVVYRGVTDTGKMTQEIAAIKQAGLGGTWTDVAPHSMSRSQKTAGNFAGTSGHLFVIKTKTGRPVEDISLYSSEREIIGMPGAQYRIVGIHENAKTFGTTSFEGPKSYKTVIELEEI